MIIITFVNGGKLEIFDIVGFEEVLVNFIRWADSTERNDNTFTFLKSSDRKTITVLKNNILYFETFKDKI
jgi:hypothetical protein